MSKRNRPRRRRFHVRRKQRDNKLRDETVDGVRQQVAQDGRRLQAPRIVQARSTGQIGSRAPPLQLHEEHLPPTKRLISALRSPTTSSSAAASAHTQAAFSSRSRGTSTQARSFSMRCPNSSPGDRRQNLIMLRNPQPAVAWFRRCARAHLLPVPEVLAEKSPAKNLATEKPVKDDQRIGAKILRHDAKRIAHSTNSWYALHPTRTYGPVGLVGADHGQAEGVAHNCRYAIILPSAVGLASPAGELPGAQGRHQVVGATASRQRLLLLESTTRMICTRKGIELQVVVATISAHEDMEVVTCWMRRTCSRSGSSSGTADGWRTARSCGQLLGTACFRLCGSGDRSFHGLPSPGRGVRCFAAKTNARVAHHIAAADAQPPPGQRSPASASSARIASCQAV